VAAFFKSGGHGHIGPPQTKKSGGPGSPGLPSSDAYGSSDIDWLGGLLVERRTSVSQIRGSIPGQVAAV